ncbi:histidinol-phosphate transaminase [Brevibacterium yomogidense]|uniref:histidinol-phosphate transaminase n=1 Tax=Brevibacterium yomogidense TaxID=946573 RepID=UPI000B359FD9|nr:histidinol-phosphate transaminase [Brevibacterium yomogidense]
MTSLGSLPLRDDLRGRSPYGAPVIDVPVRLNVNENAFDVPADVTAALQERVAAISSTLNRYPDREFTALRNLLADYLSGVLRREGRPTALQAPVPSSISPDMIWAANGSNEVLFHILQAYAGPGRSALGFGPSYSMHPLIAQSTGADWIEVPRGADFAITVDHAVDAVRTHSPDVVFLCTPNNPTGNSTPLEVIEAVYDATDGIVIVDEAYAEFAGPDFRTALSLLPGRPRLVVSRTMSKAFAFAGARLGYAAADPGLVDGLRLVRMPYHLSSLTQAAAEAALAHPDSLLAGVQELSRQRDRMVAGLREHGFDVVASDANFVLFRGVADPALLWTRLVEKGVLIRDVGIPGSLRVNAGTDAETTAFLTAMAEILSTHPDTLGRSPQ